MGIYIPNMERPESCWQCYNDGCDHWGEYGYDNSADCPLIDIVTCEECKWSKTYYVKADNSTRLCCDNYYGLDKDVDPSDFCPYGERIEK